MRTRSPVLCAKPVRTAAPLPRLLPCVTTRTVLSCNCWSTSTLPSVLPSSTTMISRSSPAGSSTARMRRTISATVLRSLSTGTMTESFLYDALLPGGCSRPGFRCAPRVPSGTTRTCAPARRAAGSSAASRALHGPDRCRGGAGSDRRPAAAGARPPNRSPSPRARAGRARHRELIGVADVDRPDDARIEQREDAPHLVVDDSSTNGSGCRRRRS